jgi:autotransporter strand-loop-strand O-heptosyltransferase
MKKIIIVVPHLSTGGLPQYTLKLIESMFGQYEIWCVEWDNITGGVLVVQRNQIHKILGDGLVTLSEDKSEFISLINSVSPDIIHFQEIPETFIDTELLRKVYNEDRKWEIVVTTHSSYTNPSKIRFTADKFVLVSDWSRNVFVPEFGEEICTVWEYPVEKKVYDKDAAKDKLSWDKSKKHVLHVGLFTAGKNQKQVFEIARKTPDINYHFVGNQAVNFQDYWEPLMSTKPENCIWHGERHNVEDFYMAADVFIFPSLFELNPLSLKEAQSYNLPIVLRQLETYGDTYKDAYNMSDNIDECIQSVRMALEHSNNTIYGSDKKLGIERKVEPTINVTFINWPEVSIYDAPDDTFDVSFIDEKTGINHYSCPISNNCWSRCTIKYVKNWLIRCVRRSDGKVFENRFEPEDKRIFVTLESKSVGDTLAWLPQVISFGEQRKCNLIISTFWNDEFRSQYPDVEFVEPGSIVHGIYAMYSIGWFFDGEKYNPSMCPSDFTKGPLGKTAADILGIEYVQRRALLAPVEYTKTKRVGLGIHSTAQTKYWNNPTGWQELTNFLTKMGYEVMVMSNEGDGYMGNFYPTGVTVLPSGDFQTLKSAILSCEFFVGIGSGLSWLSWSLGIKTVLISGFSTPISEFEGEGVIRIFNPDKCNGCYNRYKFNPGDWNWCPDHKGTDRQFECTKSITGRHVIAKIIENGFVEI